MSALAAWWEYAVGVFMAGAVPRPRDSIRPFGGAQGTAKVRDKDCICICICICTRICAMLMQVST